LLQKHIALLDDTLAFNDKTLDFLAEFMARTRRLLADPDAPGVEKPQRVAGGGKYPRIQWAHGNGWISRTKMNCANPKV
jgi:hypothetical protein